MIDRMDLFFQTKSIPFYFKFHPFDLNGGKVLENGVVCNMFKDDLENDYWYVIELMQFKDVGFKYSITYIISFYI